MSGNVSEWVEDWYGEYPTEAVSNPSGPNTGNERGSRGAVGSTIQPTAGEQHAHL